MEDALFTNLSEDKSDTANQNLMLWKIYGIAKDLLSYNESEPFCDLLHKSLELIVNTMNQSSAYIWQDRYYNNELSCMKIYEWVDGMKSVQDCSGSVIIPYSKLPSIKNAFDNGKCFNDFTENMSISEKKILEPFGVKSLLVVPINLDAKRWGFIGVNNYKSKQLFSEPGKKMILTCGFLLANAIQKKNERAKTKEADEYMQIMLNTMPIGCCFFDKNNKMLLCNDHCTRLFNLESQQEFINNFSELSPQYQPNGKHSHELMVEYQAKTFESGFLRFEWMHQNLNSEPIPAEINLVRVSYKNEYIIACYIMDLREIKTMLAEIHKAKEELLIARDEALASSKTKSEFLAKMSHEIRTPMNAIVGMSELILREAISPSAKEYATTIKQASANLLSLINDILDLSKIESGKIELANEEYLLSSVIYDVVNIINMRLTDKPILFSVFIDSTLPNCLIGDEVRLRQILLNLLTNAVKYTEKGHISFEIFAESIDKQKLNLIIEVSDTGIGIKDTSIANIFGEYTKFNASRNKGVEGTGLGLAITKKLCRAMNGDISVKSVFGEGSVFRVILPHNYHDTERIAQVNNPELHNVLLYEPREEYAKSYIASFYNLDVKFSLVRNTAELQDAFVKGEYSFVFFPSFLFNDIQNILEKSPENDNIHLSKFVAMSDKENALTKPGIFTISTPVYSVIFARILNEIALKPSINDVQSIYIRFIAPKAKILVVDDINTNLKVAKGLMSPYNMQIEVCESGIEAINLVESTSYDIVFMDHMMPEMDGVSATKKIRKIPSCKDLPIVALTANAVVGVKEMFLSNGFNDFLAKPIEITKLNEILEKWIPKDKKEAYTLELKADTNSVIEIDGIDVDAGLSKTGGSLNNFIEILDVFQKDGYSKLIEIENCMKINNIELYATHVHSLKSALASIGAGELSEAAKALEFACKNNEIDFVKDNNDKFMIDLKELLNKINEAISADKNVSTDNELRIDDIMSDLLSLKESLCEFDGILMNQTIRQLKNFCKNSNFEGKIETLEQCILMCEYDEAIKHIDDLIHEK